ncbi:nuclear transport factor 2 family protein [soil metagenome]
MTQSTYIQEYNAISKVLSKYIEGNANGTSAATKLAFHEQATIFGLDGGTVVGPEIQKLYDIVDTLGVSPKARAVIARLDIAGTAANARVDSDNVAGHRFTDFFNLLKIDGTWIIVNKVYHVHTGD